MARRSPRTPHAGSVEETSAGGLVLDSTRRAAVIGRSNARGELVWSLPKGHLESGESLEAAAVREVSEETGINGRVVAPLGVIDFYFTAEGRRVHKTVHHYLMIAEGGELNADDVEVEQVAWVPLDELHQRLGYADERRLLAKVPDLLADAS